MNISAAKRTHHRFLTLINFLLAILVNGIGFQSFQNQVICFIEYDGILHFEQDNYHGWNDEKKWERTQKNDKIKTQYAQDNNIPLIRIPYTDFDILDKQYILVDIMVDITNNVISETEFRNKLTEWAKENGWELNGFIGEYIEEGEYYK